jgi:hypothetical protein
MSMPSTATSAAALPSAKASGHNRQPSAVALLSDQERADDPEAWGTEEDDSPSPIARLRAFWQRNQGLMLIMFACVRSCQKRGFLSLFSETDRCDLGPILVCDGVGQVSRGSDASDANLGSCLCQVRRSISPVFHRSNFLTESLSSLLDIQDGSHKSAVYIIRLFIRRQRACPRATAIAKSSPCQRIPRVIGPPSLFLLKILVLSGAEFGILIIGSFCAVVAFYTSLRFLPASEALVISFLNPILTGMIK